MKLLGLFTGMWVLAHNINTFFTAGHLGTSGKVSFITEKY
jgi:hypothetical protein